MKALRIPFALIIMLSAFPWTVTTLAQAQTGHITHPSLTCKHPVKPKGTITYADWQFPATLNPWQDNEAVTVLTNNLMFDSLVGYNSHAKLYPSMATKVPTMANGLIRNGGRTIIMNLKHGMRWSNGTEITAQDIIFSWKVNMRKVTGPICQGTCDHIASIEHRGKYQLIFHFTHPFSPAVPDAVTFPLLPRAWKHGWRAGNVSQAAQKVAQDQTFNFEGPSYPTNGPYQVKSVRYDRRIVLAPNKYYRTESCGAFAKKMIFVYYGTQRAMEAAAAAGKVDVSQDYTTRDLPTLEKNKGRYQVQAIPGFAYEHLELNSDATYHGKINPLHKSRARLALALALNTYQLIRQALLVNQAKVKQIAAWTPWLTEPSLTQPFADTAIRGQWDPLRKKYVIPGTAGALADAKHLLRGTKCAHGCTLAFVTTGDPVRQAEAAVIGRDWGKLGVKLVLSYSPANVLFGDWIEGGILAHGNFQVADFAWEGSAEPDNWRDEMVSSYIDRATKHHSDINQNYAGIRNMAINRAFAAAAGTYSTTVRAHNYAAIQTAINHNAYWIGLYYRDKIATVDSHVANVQVNPANEVTWNGYAWRYKP